MQGRVTAPRRTLTAVPHVTECAEKALKGDAKSAAELGKMLLDGEGTRSQARHWLELAAEGGVVESQYLLGVHLNEGPGPEEEPSNSVQEGSREAREKVLRDIEEAKKEARRKRKERLEKQRSKKAVAASSNEGTAPATDADESVIWLRTAARAGHGAAMVYLGNVLLVRMRAGGPLADGQEALLWYQKAAALPIPVPDALFNLGTLYFSGQPGLVEANHQRSLAYFELSAECGDASALFWLGHCHMAGEGGVANVDEEKGLKLLQSAAELGHPAAHYHLALAHRRGAAQGGTKAFLSHLEAAAEGGDGDALFMQAELHLRGSPGDGVAKDETRGVRLLEEAARAGHADATVSLGAIWYTGLPGGGVEQDKRRAFELYNTAAEQGHKQAWRNLAAMYLAGDGVPQSEEVARQIASVILKGDRNEGDGEAK
jgi:TPR repeat protein